MMEEETERYYNFGTSFLGRKIVGESLFHLDVVIIVN